MPAQRQTNQHSLTACLPEVRDTDGTVYPAVEVAPGESIDWPQPIAGFTGWVSEPGPGTSPVPAPPEPGKSRTTKASVKASDTTPEATE